MAEVEGGGAAGQRPRAVLAVFAHPDDEVLCAGGTLALCRALGQRVTVVCATRGELGPVADPTLLGGSNLSEVREGELRESCAHLGVSDVRVLGWPDAGLDWAARSESALGVLVGLIRELRPDVILTFGPDGLYGHADHVALGEVVSQARDAAADPLRFAGASVHVGARLFYPVITAQDVAAAVDAMARAGRCCSLWSLAPEHFHATAAQVSARVDVMSVLPAKLRALRSHRTQLEMDNLLSCMTPEVAAQFLGVEAFRCADGRSGDPLGG